MASFDAIRKRLQRTALFCLSNHRGVDSRTQPRRSRSRRRLFATAIQQIFKLVFFKAVFVSRVSHGFGVAYDRSNNLSVSEAFGGKANASATSSYELDGDGRLETISYSVPTEQSAACWVVVTENGKYAYTSDTGNGVITGYRVSRNGALSLLEQSGFSAGTGGATTKPVGLVLSRRSEYLYSVNSGAGTLLGWAVKSDGSLERVAGAKHIPLSATGLVAR